MGAARRLSPCEVVLAWTVCIVSASVAHLLHLANEVGVVVARARNTDFVSHLEQLAEVGRLGQIELGALLNVQLLRLFVLRRHTRLLLERLR